MTLVLCQAWSESEKGWGQRPDGYSLHLTKEAHQRYMRDNWDNRPNKNNPPEEYSFPDGSPFLVDVTDEQLAKLTKTDGVRVYDKVPKEYVPTEGK